MGAHSVKDGGRVAKIAVRGLLSATAALALLGGGAGVALAGEASHGSSHDSDHRDKGDKHDGKDEHHEKDRHEDGDKKDRDGDAPKCEVEEDRSLVNGLLLPPSEPECKDDDESDIPNVDDSDEELPEGPEVESP